MTSITEQLLFTTVRIEIENKDGERPVGTGFLFGYEEQEKSMLFLVTNKHLIIDAKKGFFSLIQGKGEKEAQLGSTQDFIIDDNFESLWFAHEDENVDIAVLPFGHIYDFGRAKKELFIRWLSSDLIPNPEDEKGFDALESIMFVGYPQGIWDSVNNLPIMRMGTTATPITVDFDGGSAFLVDAAVFPGSSGSPVFLYNNGGAERTKEGHIVLGGKPRFFFLGVLSEVFCREERAKVISGEGLEGVQLLTNQMLGLGMVFKAKTVLETIKTYIKATENNE